MPIVKSITFRLGTHCPFCNRHTGKLYYLDTIYKADVKHCAHCFADFVEGEQVILGE